MKGNNIPCVIITRFNLKIEFECRKRSDSNVSKSPWLDEIWLEKRFSIFDKYTFPSVLNQKEICEWIVLFHKDIPLKYRNRIKDYKDQINLFSPLFLDNDECNIWQNKVADYLRKKYSCCTRIVTIRLDSDDVIHSSYIKNIKKIAETNRNNSYFITASNGLQYDMRSKEVIKYNYKQNHFLALVENLRQEKNHILFYDHSLISNDLLYELSDNCPMWIEIISDTNYSNSKRWKFSDICVEFNTKEQFPFVSFRWETRLEWRLEIIRMFLITLGHKIKQVIRIILSMG